MKEITNQPRPHTERLERIFRHGVLVDAYATTSRLAVRDENLKLGGINSGVLFSTIGGKQKPRHGHNNRKDAGNRE